MTDRVMVDTETLSTSPNAIVLSIGAVRFDAGIVSSDTFYRNISIESCQEAGLVMDADTLEFWLDQDEEVQHCLTGGEPLAEVLAEFAEWYEGADEFWANSPAFDAVILESAFEAVGQEHPWGHGDTRDHRTLRDLGVDVEDPPMDGGKHDALADAVYQARLASRILERLDQAEFPG